MKWRRWNLATHDSGKLRPDYRPRNFLKVMKFEIAIVCVGIFMGLMLPRMQRAMTASRAGAQDMKTAKYMAHEDDERVDQKQKDKAYYSQYYQYS